MSENSKLKYTTKASAGSVDLRLAIGRDDFTFSLHPEGMSELGVALIEAAALARHFQKMEEDNG